ncbi:hypothetical protein [Thermoflexus sp.]|uniref:hypothetical protein n=1 Tax=Thermoflexus sp. TaxID=1969742 RepID=UPI001761335C|nr:hypothetical protein [Thermoflexus sp.]
MRWIEPEWITVVEGPTPQFQPAREIWAFSIYEGPTTQPVAVCQMRTFNGEKMLERCRRAWEEGRPVQLDFPAPSGERHWADVIAARVEHWPEGDVLVLWVRRPRPMEHPENA